MNFIDNVWLACLAGALGGLGGFLVVLMNALLQHLGGTPSDGRGAVPIAVQNFNEQASILGLGAFYSHPTCWGCRPLVAAFGVVVAGAM